MYYVVRKKKHPDQFVQDSGGFGDLQTAYIYPNIDAVENEGALDPRTEEPVPVEVRLTVIETT